MFGLGVVVGACGAGVVRGRGTVRLLHASGMRRRNNLVWSFEKL